LASWKVLEYERSPEMEMKAWRFQTYSEAEEFRKRRQEFYRLVGLDEERTLTKPLPEVSGGELELVKKILQTPEFLDHVRRTFNLP
jgi:ABC-type glutathione transport system ATPase component